MKQSFSEFTPAPITDGVQMINGQKYVGDGRGGWQPLELVKPQHQLEDETVRKVIGFMVALSEQIARFKEHTFEDIGAFEALLAQEYGMTVGGEKGNKTLMSVDGLFKITVQVADQIAFGPELNIAKGLVDECLNEWASDSRPEIRAIVTRAFNTDKAGQINRAEIFMLLRLDIDDPRWMKAMEAIRSAMRTVGSKTYVRGYRRDSYDAPWHGISLDIAKL